MPVHVLTGKNDYAIHQRQDELRDAFVAEHGADGVVRLDGEVAEFDDVRAAVYAQGLFATHTCVVLTNVAKNKHLQEKLVEQGLTVPNEVEFIIADSDLDKRGVFYKAAKKAGFVEEFAELDEFALARWAAEYFTELGGKMSSQVARNLVERVGPDQWLMHNELHKLLYHEQPITREVIEDVVELSFRDTIFNLLDTAFAGRGEETLRMYRDMITNKVEPHYILSMIAWQLHALMVVAHAPKGESPDQIAKATKLSPYVVRKCQTTLAQMSLHRLRQVVDETIEVDYKAKTSAATDVEALVEQLLVQIATS